MSETEKIAQCVEVLCCGGCKIVRSAISSLQNNNSVEAHEQLVNELDEHGRAVLLAELVSIMAVYEDGESQVKIPKPSTSNPIMSDSVIANSDQADMIDWQEINSIFLDMDGTLLDLHFDNYFWREHVPLRYAQTHDLKIEEAREKLFSKFSEMEGTMEWYCVDYWTEQLGMDIAMLKEEVDHLIAVHPHVVEFLEAIRANGKRVVLVTNAHGKSLELKMNRTQLGGHFDALICSHDLGLPKEDVRFWEKLQKIEPFSSANTLLVDDSLPVLRSAREYGIQHLLAVYKPDTKGPLKEVEDFMAIHRFKEIMPG